VVSASATSALGHASFNAAVKHYPNDLRTAAGCSNCGVAGRYDPPGNGCEGEAMRESSIPFSDVNFALVGARRSARVMVLVTRFGPAIIFRNVSRGGGL
jgi:hypothetical protein